MTTTAATTAPRCASDDLIAAVPDALAMLVELQRSAAAPLEARQACRRLDARHPGVGATLIAARERWSGAHHYELVLDAAGAGAATLAYCADRGAPWLTRSASRLDDDVVARIDGVPVRVLEAIDLLDLAHDTGLADKLITAVVIRDAIARHGLAAAPVDDAELQRALDDFRIAHGLFDAEDTRRWLDDRGLTLALLERSLEDQVRARMLRDRVTAADLEQALASRRAELDAVVAGVVRLPSEAAARELARRAAVEPFHAVVEAAAAAGGADDRADYRIDYRIERWRRDDCPGELRAALFDGPPGEPQVVATRVVRVIARTACSELDEATRRALRDRLFARWIAARRAEARIEWCRA